MNGTMDPDALFKLCAAVSRCGPDDPRDAELRAVLEDMRTKGDRVGMPKVLLALASARLFHNRAAEAEPLIDEALAAVDGAVDPVTNLWLLNLKGVLEATQARFVMASETFTAMLCLAQDTHNANLRFIAALNRAWTFLHLDDTDRAEPAFHDAFAVAYKANGEAAALCGLTLTYLRAGRSVDARDAWTRTDAVFQTIEGDRGVQRDRDLHAANAAWLALLEDRAEDAAREIVAVLDRRSFGLPLDRFLGHYVHAEALLSLGRATEALDTISTAVALGQGTELQPMYARMVELRSRVHVALGRVDDALADLREAWNHARRHRTSEVGTALRELIRHHEGEAWRAAEIELQATNSALRKANDALDRAREEAEQAAISRYRFLSSMSHEIRTPLNGVLATVDLLGDTPTNAEQDELIGVLSRSADLTLEIINDVLDLGKLESGRFELHIDDFELLQPARDTLSLLEARASAHDTALVLEHDDSLASHVRGDGRRLQQVLVNLVGNAIKFTKGGTVTLGVHADGGRVRFSVRDTGVGIPLDQQEGLFDAYQQVQGTMSGTGLGLAICKKLVEAAGGDIALESALGEGTTFHFSLMLPAVTAESRSEGESAGRLDDLHVLLAEDNLVNQLVIRRLLERLGARVSVVGDGAQAVDAVADHDVVLMDMQMPVMDGLEATRELRRRGCAVPIVALTASTLAEDRRAAAESGMDGFASKPARRQDLARAILGVLTAD